AVLAGDRSQGGSVSVALKELGGREAITEILEPFDLSHENDSEDLLENVTESLIENGLESEVENEFEHNFEHELKHNFEHELKHNFKNELEHELENHFEHKLQNNLTPGITDSEVQIDADLSLDQLFGWTDSPEVDRDHSIEPNETQLVPLPVEPQQPKQALNNDEWITPVAVSRSPLNAPAVDQPDSPRYDPVRVDIEQLKHLDYLAGELLISQGKQTTQDQQLHGMLQEWRSHLHQHQQTLYELQDCIEQLSHQVAMGQPTLAHSSTFSIATSTMLSAHRFDTLELERYHDLHQLMQTSLNEIVQLDNLAEEIEQTNKQGRRTRDTHRRHLTQVRDDLTALRMQPLRDLVNRFPRLLQQLTATHGKPVELVLTGTHVLVDKAIAAKLYDPLLHLIRNAFDHGIEPPEQRRKHGKPEVGRIEIRATQQGTQTIIEVCDDGRGIDLQRVAQRAIELNVLTPEQARTLPESQLLDILFKPGFSTAKQVSDLSGRGIGLDVVNNQLQSMNGSIAISSVPQQGTTFSLKIPLSLTTTKLLVCQAANFTYALPIEQVEQIVRLHPDQLQTSIGQSVMHWQQGTEEFVVPIYCLSELVGYSALSSHLRSATNLRDRTTTPYQTSRPSENQASPILLLHTLYGRRGLKVDRVVGEHELVIRPLSPSIAPPPYVYGCCILGNSQSALVVDIEILMQLTTEVESSPEPALPPVPPSPLPLALSPAFKPSLQLDRPDIIKSLPAPATESKAILVVDVSLTLRQSVMRLLERAGHRVIPAEDGLEALVQLQQHTNIHLIICDLEMPRLNGFEFLSQFRQHTHGATIPVIILTSRTNAKHRQIATELGASAYLTKPFDPHQLITTVERWLHHAATS
ncbi:MAG TPA: response regulator, partial [Allocoleopsis sp.]